MAKLRKLKFNQNRTFCNHLNGPLKRSTKTHTHAHKLKGKKFYAHLPPVNRLAVPKSALLLSSYLVRFIPCANGQPESERCVKYVPFMCPLPSQPASNNLRQNIQKHTQNVDFSGILRWKQVSVNCYKPTVGQLMPSILIAEVDVLEVCEDRDTLDDGTNDVKGSDDI